MLEQIILEAKCFPDTNTVLPFGARNIKGTYPILLPVCCTIISIEVHVLKVIIYSCGPKAQVMTG
jgi:hypothetical protein